MGSLLQNEKCKIMGSIFNEKNVGGINGGDKHVKKGEGTAEIGGAIASFFLACEHQFYLMQLLHHHLRK